MIGRIETWSLDHGDTEAFRAKEADSEVQQMFRDISSADLTILKEMSVFTSSKNFEGCLKSLPDAISGAEATLKCGFRTVVVLSLSAIIISPGSFPDPRGSLMSSMTMFKRNMLFQSCSIPKKLHELVLAQMAPKAEESAEEPKIEKEDHGKKDKKEKKVKQDKKSKKKRRDVADDDDNEEAGTEHEKSDLFQTPQKEKKSKKEKKHKKQ